MSQRVPTTRPDVRGGQRGHPSSGEWPASALAAVGRAFDLLVVPPTVYMVDGGAFPGLPAGPIVMGRLRELLLSEGVLPPVRDAVWRELVARARRPARDGQGWTVIAAGMALPGLTRAAAGLCRGWHGETADIDAEVVAGFVARLRTLDTSGPRVLGRLIDAAIRAGRRARALAGDVDVVRVDAAWSRPPAHPWDHPDWVLARAVAAGVLDRVEARLIGATRLEDMTLVEAAAAVNVDPAMAADWRWRAECRLRAALAAGEVSDVGLTASFRRGDTPQRLREQRLRFAREARRDRRRHAADLELQTVGGE